MIIRFASVLAVPVAGLALLAATPASASEDNKCLVKVDRAYSDGTYAVTRQVLESGDCICYIQTGKDPQGDAIENKIAGLRRDRECDDAAVMMIPAGTAAVAGATAGKFALMPLLAGGAAAAAAAGIAASGGNGPSSP